MKNSDTHLLISVGAFITFIIGSFVFSFLDRRKIQNELANPSGKLISPNDRIIVNRNKMFFIGIVLILFGGHSVLFVRINTIYMTAVSAMLVIGIFILLFFLLKRKPTGWLKFSEEGITIGLRNGSHTIPWKSFQTWRIVEVFGNISVLINLKEPISESFRIESGEPNYTQRVQKIFSQNFSIFGAHVMILLGIWNAAPEDIVYTIKKYANNIDPI